MLPINYALGFLERQRRYNFCKVCVEFAVSPQTVIRIPISPEFNWQVVANTLWAVENGTRIKPGKNMMGQLERQAEVMSGPVRGVQSAEHCKHAVSVCDNG